GAIAFQWHTRVRYMINEPLIYLVGVFAIDRKAFGKLSGTDQAITRQVMEATFRRLNAQNRRDNEKAHEALRAQGVEFIEAPAEAVNEWRALAEKVNYQLAGEGYFSPELVRRAYELVGEYR